MIPSHTVLLVAPEGEARDRLLQALRSKGYLVSVAARARSALEFVSALRYELIACWPVLPDGDRAGFLCEAQRRSPTSALLLLGTDPAGADLDFEVLFRLSQLARGRATRRPPEGRN